MVASPPRSPQDYVVELSIMATSVIDSLSCMARFSVSPRWLCLISLVLIHTVAAVQLAPISHSPHIQDASSVLKRQESFTGELDLQDFETFYWGAPAGTNLIYANLTVYFPEEYERVIAMERFADQLKSVQCAEDMMLEFKDDASFEYAKDVWNWVNDDVNRTFIMVTNYEGCADEMERLPFVVSNIRYDEVANKAFLKADLKQWEEVAHTYTLNVGHTPITPVHRMLTSRNLLPRDSDFSMNLVSGFDKNLFSATVGGWTTSVDAVVRTVGSLDVDFDIDVGLLKLKSASMTITPENVAASIQLALTERGKLGKAYTWQDTIISIPMNGIEIAKVVKLGAFLDVDVGFTMSEWEGTATANLGARMELSNSAIVKIDLVNSKNNQFSGWTPKFSSIPLTLNAKVEGSARVFAEPNVKIEASALGKGWNVGLNLQMPYIEADFAAMLDTTGVCNTKKTLGVDVDARIGVELSVQAATKGNEGNPFWSQELFSSEWDLFSKCLSFGPDNAKPGEIAEPKPPKSKSKKSKSKPPKPSKTPKPKPKSSKPAVTLKPTPRPKKPAPTPARPSKAVSTKIVKPTDAGKASSKASPKPTPGTSKQSSKSPKPTPDDDKPSSKPKPSTPTGSDDKRISSSKNPSSVPASHSTRSVSTSVPFRNSSIAVSGITKPPSTLTIATLSVSSSASSSAPEVCSLDGRGCNTCGVLADSGGLDAQYFSQQIPDSSEVEKRSLHRRFDTRLYTFNCGNGDKTIRMARYPQFADLKLPQITVSNFYRAETSTDCLNHQITPITATNTAILGTGKLQYEMEHIYEGVWILRFLEYLSKVEKIPCADMEAMFFTKWGPSSKNPAFITRLMESLGSRKNQDDLVFLWKDINGAKHRLFDLDNDIIAETGSTGFRNIDATLKVDRIATVGRAMEYMARPDIGARLLSTAKRVEGELAALTNALPSILNSASLANLKTLKDPGVLVYKHRKWLNGFLHDRNHNAITSMRRWASVASTEFVKSTPTMTDAAKASKWTETTKFLEALQTAPPVGFKWRQYAPLLPEP